MRKIRDILFTENTFSITVFSPGMMIIMVIAWLLMKHFILGYIVWQNEIYNGTFLHFIYMAVGFLNMLYVDKQCQNRSVMRMMAAGVTPLASVLTLRWFFSGFVIAKFLILILIIYSVYIIFQTICIIVKNKKIKIISRGMNHILVALSVISITGMTGYCLTGMDVSDKPAEDPTIMVPDVNLWDSNQETLRRWQKDTYAGLSDEEKMQLFQQLIDLECTYWGIELIPLEVEEYESETVMGYYDDEDYIISIREEAFDMPREEVIDALLHETHHAYVHKLVESVDWTDENIEKNKNLRIYKEIYKYKEGIENYISSEEDYNSYYNNPIEVAAREYAEEWTDNYLNYIDQI